jgi:hypothetical protein
MEKVMLFLDKENILLIGFNWYIFPESYSGVEPAGICVSLNHAGGGCVSLLVIPLCFAENALDFAFSCRWALRSNGRELNLDMGFMGSEQIS